MNKKSSSRRAIGTATLAVLLLPGIGQASTLTAEQALNQFNLIVLGDAVSYSNADGRAFVGGNLIGGDYVQHVSDTPVSDYAGLTVLGNAGGSGNWIHVNGLGTTVLGNLYNTSVNSGSGIVAGNATSVSFSGGPAAVGGTATSVNFNAGQYADPAGAIASASAVATSNDFASLFADTSANLSTRTSTGSTVDISYGTATFNAVPIDGVAVFDLTAIDTEVFAASQFSFNLNGATTVILNSDETDISINANFLSGSAASLGSKLLWNFYVADNVTLGSQFGGSILATSALLTNYQNIEGSVVAGSLSQHGEIHLQPFTGTITSPVPEADSVALLLAGFGLVGFLARQRRKA